MPVVLLLSIALSACAAIAVDWNEQRPPLFKLLKPLTTILVIALALAAPDSFYRNCVVAGLVLSLAGDIALMYRGNGAFLSGLGSFLLAHVAFLGALTSGLHEFAPPLWIAPPLLAAVVYFAWLLPRTGKLAVPVLCYGLVLLGMALAASMRWQAHGTANDLLAVAGALLFIVSDSVLARRRFVGQFPGGQAWTLGTYWPAITLIALSAGAYP